VTRIGCALVLLALAVVGCDSTGAATGDTSVDIASSVFRVRGEGCRVANIGTAFVVGPELALTNAHVVAGVTSGLVVVDAAETAYEATLVAFDPVDDLALLEVEGLTAPPLRLGNATPGAGRIYDARVAGMIDVMDIEVTRLVDIESGDIYDDGTYLRKGLEIAGDIGPGTSGAPIVQDGLVVGVAFAEVRDGGTVFATASSEIRASLAEPRSVLALPAGRCRR
jgi:S1-C subfamily serine protease